MYIIKYVDSAITEIEKWTGGEASFFLSFFLSPSLSVFPPLPFLSPLPYVLPPPFGYPRPITVPYIKSM